MNDKHRLAIARISDELPGLRRYALALTHDAERSDDLVQESVLRAVCNICKWEPGTNLRSWLMTILHNVFINEVTRHQPLLTKTGEIDPNRSTPSDQEHRDDLHDVDRALDCLGPYQRQIIWLACVEECEFKDIARQLHIPIGTVRSRLHRARIQLKLTLDTSQPG
jgi:RNA polymerase sigma factor (sigma-70 family)